MYPLFFCLTYPNSIPAARTQILNEIAGSPPNLIEAIELDVTKPSHIDNVMKKLLGKPLAAIINNAAILQHDWNEKTFELHMDTNLRGPVRLARALLPSLKLGDGRVINLSTGLAVFTAQAKPYFDLITQAQDVDSLMKLPFIGDVGDASRDYLPYKTTKAALNRATQLLAKSPDFEGVPVVSVCPGWVKTDMGGPNATRSVAQGAASVLAMLKPDVIETGIFTRDGKSISF